MNNKKLFAKEDVARIVVFALIYTFVSTMIHLLLGRFNKKDDDGWRL